MTFHQPSIWFLVLLALLPLVWWRWSRSRRRSAVYFSSTEALRAAGSTWAARLRWVVPALRLLAMGLLVVCLARPQKADEHTRIFTEGIAIQLVVDRSGSMLAMDFAVEGRPATRLDAVKNVVEDFVDGGDDLPGRPDDLIGLISFATFADSVCPLTLDHDHLVSAVRQTEVAPTDQDRSTAIGDAIALGVERIRGLEERSRVTGERSIKSRVMILLTDGENNAGDIDPMTAAEMAHAFDIRIYTIGAGSKSGQAPIRVIDPVTKRVTTRMERVSIDEETLEAIAGLTGGRYFRATDSSSLQAVYAQIDELERTEIEQRRYTDYEEMALRSVTLGGLTLPALLPIAFIVLVLEIVLANTRLRTLP